MTLLTIALVVLGTYVTSYVLYQALLFGANALIADPQEVAPSRVRHFNVLVPAHNEELYLPRLVESLLAQDYPRDAYDVTVIADNCTDATASVCRQFGVNVLERVQADRRGKGYAIGWALETAGLAGFDAALIVDADSIADSGLLRYLNLQMDRGDRVIQCYNGVANPQHSWFTRLMDVSRTIANEIIHPGKRKLGLSSHLMGNGMCFDRKVLESCPWNAFSVGEDWEYYARLVLAGEYVGYCRHARVYHQESTTLRQASAQRLRWSSSRFQMLRRYVPSLVAHALRTGRFVYLDASLPLVFPNPSLGINLTLAGLMTAALLWRFGGSPIVLAWWLVLLVAQLAMYVIGALHTRDKRASTLSLVLAPVFLIWKLVVDLLSLFGVGSKKWKPTARRPS